MKPLSWLFHLWRYGIDLAKIRRKLRDHLIDREGFETRVYHDHLGHLTVGVGHLITDRDPFEEGDEIPREVVEMLLEEDMEEALRAALRQARELNQYNEDFIVALGSVNFQLGTGWTQKFPNTYAHLKTGTEESIKTAVKNLKRSLWARQTPVRVTDFVDAIQTAYEVER